MFVLYDALQVGNLLWAKMIPYAAAGEITKVHFPPILWKSMSNNILVTFPFYVP